MKYNAAIEDASKEFERTGEIANSAELLINAAAELTAQVEELKKALKPLAVVWMPISSHEEAVANAKELLNRIGEDND